MIINGLSYGFGWTNSLLWRLYTDGKPDEKQKEEVKKWREYFQKRLLPQFLKEKNK